MVSQEDAPCTLWRDVSPGRDHQTETTGSIAVIILNKAGAGAMETGLGEDRGWGGVGEFLVEVFVL